MDEFAAGSYPVETNPAFIWVDAHCGQVVPYNTSLDHDTLPDDRLFYCIENGYLFQSIDDGTSLDPCIFDRQVAVDFPKYEAVKLALTEQFRTPWDSKPDFSDCVVRFLTVTLRCHDRVQRFVGWRVVAMGHDVDWYQLNDTSDLLCHGPVSIYRELEKRWRLADPECQDIGAQLLVDNWFCIQRSFDFQPIDFPWTFYPKRILYEFVSLSNARIYSAVDWFALNSELLGKDFVVPIPDGPLVAPLINDVSAELPAQEDTDLPPTGIFIRVHKIRKFGYAAWELCDDELTGQYFCTGSEALYQNIMDSMGPKILRRQLVISSAEDLTEPSVTVVAVADDSRTYTLDDVLCYDCSTLEPCTFQYKVSRSLHRFWFADIETGCLIEDFAAHVQKLGIRSLQSVFVPRLAGQRPPFPDYEVVKRKVGHRFDGTKLWVRTHRVVAVFQNDRNPFLTWHLIGKEKAARHCNAGPFVGFDEFYAHLRGFFVTFAWPRTHPIWNPALLATDAELEDELRARQSRSGFTVARTKRNFVVASPSSAIAK